MTLANYCNLGVYPSLVGGWGSGGSIPKIAKHLSFVIASTNNQATKQPSKQPSNQASKQANNQQTHAAASLMFKTCQPWQLWVEQV